MSEAKFTPGPWYIDSRLIVGPRINSDGADDGFISEVCDASLSMGDRKANSHLIAAAPDLYEALDNLVAILELDTRSYVFDAVCSARAALAKARGETP